MLHALLGANPLLLLALSTAPAGWATATTFYVGPSGNDGADATGTTAASPFATIERALTAFALSRAPSGSVLLLNGTYSLDRPVDITASATASVDVASGGRLKVSALHPGGATLSGGIVVKGWRRSAGGGGVGSQLWEAPLVSALRSYGRFPRFRQLFIDGRRANRSSFKLKNVWHATQADLPTAGGKPQNSYPAGDVAAFHLGLVTDDPSAADWPPGVVGECSIALCFVCRLASNTVLLSTEVVFTGRLATHDNDPHHNMPWNEPRCPIERVEPLGPPTPTVPHMLLRIAQPCWDNAQAGSFFGSTDWLGNVNIPDHFENGPHPLALLTGEFLVDEAGGLVHYHSNAGEVLGDGGNTVAVVPMLERLLTVGPRAKGVELHGISFEHATWHQPSSAVGYFPLQAGVGVSRNLSFYPKASWEQMPAAVAVIGSSDVTVQQSSFRRLGGAGLSIGQGSRDSKIVGCLMDDISGNGIILGGVANVGRWNNEPITNATADALRLSALNNHVQRTGREWHGSVAIMAGYLDSGVIAHNLLQNLSYSGVNLGWGWGSNNPTGSGNNRVENNSIINFCQVLNDCGGIYTLGAQPGSTLEGNWMVGDPAKLQPWPLANNQGLYHDQGSTGFLDTGNVIQQTDCWLSMNPPSDQNINVSGNFIDGNENDTIASTICVALTPSEIVQNNVKVTRGTKDNLWPALARAAMANAGLTSRFPLPPTL